MGRGKYTVNEVEDRTHVPGGTLRQWERRYDFPCPERSESGYRLYSEDDIRDIQAMKRHIDDGIPASRAAELVQERLRDVVMNTGRPTEALRNALIDALVALDEEAADRIFSEAHALHPVETVLNELIRPAMVELGQRWHDGNLLTTTEHFASSYVQGRLRSLLSFTGQNSFAPVVVVACAPLDQHELGALMLAVSLRRRGYHVLYFGANTPVADLVATTKERAAVALMISASTGESLDELRKRRSLLRDAAPVVVFGGPAFNQQPDAAEELGGVFLADNIVDAARDFDELAAQRANVRA